MQFLDMQLARIHSEINSIAGHATGWSSLGNKSHGWLWNCWLSHRLEFTGKSFSWLDIELLDMLLAGFD